MTRVAAVVVSHGDAEELRVSLPALAAQVDELFVIGNIPGSVADVPEGARVLRNERPLGFAANANRGFAETTGEFVVLGNPDAVPEPGAIATLLAFAEAHPRCGVAGPRMLGIDGAVVPSRRRFPTVGGTLVRRTPLRRPVPAARAAARPLPPRRGADRAGARRLAARRLHVPAPLDARRARRLRPGLPALRRGHRPLLPRGAGRLGALVRPGAVVRHEWKRATDRRFFTRRTLWHWRGIARFVRKHPERLRAFCAKAA